MGGVQVWTETAETAETAEATAGAVSGQVSRWMVHHRLARGLARVGWHTDPSDGHVLVLGWSPSGLRYRARLLQAALRGRLADYQATAESAVTCAVRLQAGASTPPQDAPHAGSQAAIVAATGAHVRTLLRWPAELAELTCIERSSQVERLQLLLGQVAGLEVKVAAACRQHVRIARALAGWVCDQPRRRHSRRRAARAGPGPAMAAGLPPARPG
ncbi:hypothetical protein [Nonomuraea sp. NPDC049709]|uniref:hypothetical protein n=1 Tax=Nonomuraea sp. NPDC049709 TaxID=3154736 RepID=UPI003439493B